MPANQSNLASPAVTIRRKRDGRSGAEHWKFYFNTPARKEVVANNKFVEVSYEKNEGRIRFRFVMSESSRRPGSECVSIVGDLSSGCRCATAAVPALGKLCVNSNRQFVLYSRMPYSEWFIDVRSVTRA